MRSNTRLLTILAAGALLLASAAATAAAQATDYVIGRQDVLSISVLGTDISGKYTVEADGTFTFALIGRVSAAGKTPRELEADLRKHLADGYFKNPQVSVAVEQYRSQQIFIVGEVRSPGAYPLTGDMTLIEALARAGSTTPAASGEALIVHPRTSKAGPLLPGQDKEAEVEKVDVKALQSGTLSQTYRLRDGDTIFLPAAELIYVYGQIKNPGSFPIKDGTTVLQALSLAGGVTDRGSTSRLRVSRVVDGTKRELRVKLTDVVQPGDTLIVPERFF
jgi:polysaccharide export outer membrane protein